MQVATAYNRTLQQFRGTVRLTMAGGRVSLDVPADALTIIEGSNVIIDDGVNPRRLVFDVASIEELPEQ